MFKKILIANRGEIAVRIIRTCMKMGIKTVAIFSEVDRNELYVKLADEAICIGPAEQQKSYLNYFSIISAAIYSEADAIHPGYGFLSENYYFASICEKVGITFIGPLSETIKLMGNKINSRNIAKKCGVKVLEAIENVECIDSEISKYIKENLEFPVIVKAANGGGGKGIRIVKENNNLSSSFNNVKNEAKKYFNNKGIYIEKYLENSRHIEIQIIGDKFGNVIHLGERNCSLQRKNQKIIEESPSLFLDDDLREKMSSCAVLIAKAINYIGLGTVEFLLDENNNCYFLEMNTRIQVEHPITEMITGIDLVEEQIKIAYGFELEYKQEDITIRGHSIECRINAEDPENNYAPSSGCINKIIIPSGFGVRVDSAAYSNCIISHYYDSMIAKVISYGCDRQEAIKKMRNALNEFHIKGVKTNINLHLKILNSSKFIEGKYNTRLIDEEILI